jgi:superfamily II DNA or RNA helicase
VSSDKFDSIVSAKAERLDYQEAWKRQRETARAFIERFEAGYDTQLLADEVGMGKTYVAMAVISAKLLRATKNDRRALLITPPSAVLRSKWEQEIRSFSHNYLVKETRRRSLRPLIVRNFWELVANLHDYENDQEISKITEDLLLCILDSVWQWGVKNDYLKNQMNRFPRMKEFDQNSVSALQFSSRYSMAAWWAYLDEFKARHEHSISSWIRNLRSEEQNQDSRSACNSIKIHFKKFAAEQDKYEPNVLILGMSALRSRVDQLDARRFNTFILGVLLTGRWKETRRTFLNALGENNILLPGADDELLSRLTKIDLYRTRDCVKQALDNDEELRNRWLALGIKKSDSAEVQKQVQGFFKDFMKAVIGAKAKESGIELAVVDEAHNWKDGKNGGRHFRETFAPAITHKLLMSATPFQLAEGEMRRVFSHAATPGGKTQEVLTQIYEKDRVVDHCITTNDLFQKSWDRLGDDLEDLTLLHTRIAQVAPDGIRRCLEEMHADPAVSPNLKEFCRSAVNYRNAIESLARFLRQIVVRHVKPRGHRSFHAGADYGTNPVQQRTSLYATDGMSKESYEFINFLAMRLDQLLRIDSGVLDAANAHLMGGLTSSNEAFKKGAAGAAILARSKSAPNIGTSRYMAMFIAALDHHEHPKVLATVDHAMSNYLNGRKTLIFCERVETLKEIDRLLRGRMENELPGADLDVESKRAALLKNESFVEMRLARMLCSLQFGGDVLAAEDLLTDLRPKARNFAVQCLSRSSAKVTERRVMRLLDLWVLPEIGKRCRLKRDALKLFKVIQLSATSPDPQQFQRFVESLLLRDALCEDSMETIEIQVDAVAERYFGRSINLWEGDAETDFIEATWALINSEAELLLRDSGALDELELGIGFYSTVIRMQTGLRKVLFRPDLFRRYVGQAGSLDVPEAVHMGVRKRRGDSESTWNRMARFVKSLVEANGTINTDDTTNTRRRSLWRGVNLQGGRRELLQDPDSEARILPEDFAVQTLDGSKKSEQRVVLCAAFNSPLAPDVLICTSIGSEGIDLHKECAEIIHHDLPWNPARLEQRIGRIDRVGSLAEVSNPRVHVRVGIPFQEQSYERFQYNVLLSRAQRFEVLLGKPDFDINALDEEDVAVEDGSVTELVVDADATTSQPPPCLPENLAQWFAVDLSLEAQG